MPIGSQTELDALIGVRFHARQQDALRPLVTATVLAEHQARPLGQHGDDLQRLLNYLGAFPIDGKLIVEHDGGEQWFAARLVGDPPTGVRRIAGPFASEGAAVDAIFRQRLRDVFGIEPDEL